MNTTKLLELQELSRIDTKLGQQFITVYLNLTSGQSGHVSYGLNWKMDMGEIDFRNLDEAIEIVKKLRKKIDFS